MQNVKGKSEKAKGFSEKLMLTAKTTTKCKGLSKSIKKNF